jgi:hypothetical protein
MHLHCIAGVALYEIETPAVETNVLLQPLQPLAQVFPQTLLPKNRTSHQSDKHDADSSQFRKCAASQQPIQ